jgi:hypothetical protein
MKTSARKLDAEDAAQRIREILNKIDGNKSGLEKEDILSLTSMKKIQRNLNPLWFSLPLISVLCGIASVGIATALSLGLHTHTGLARVWITWRGYDLYESQPLTYTVKFFDKVE